MDKQAKKDKQKGEGLTLDKSKSEAQMPKGNKQPSITPKQKTLQPLTQGKSEQNFGQGETKEKSMGLRSNSVSQAKIPRNVTEYAHFLQHEYITEKDIEWVLKLRNQDTELQDRLSKIPNQAFGVSEKSIETQQQLHSVKDINIKSGIVNFQHLIRHRLGPTPTQGMVEFETSLRATKAKDPKLSELEKQWNNIPKKDRHQFPEFLPAIQEENQLKQTFQQGKVNNQSTPNFSNFPQFTQTFMEQRLKKDDLQLGYSGFDGGSEAYPKYNNQFRYQNFFLVQHLCTGKQSSLPEVQWELSLR